MALQGTAKLLREALGRAKLENYLDAAAGWLESEGVAEWEEVVEDIDGLGAHLQLKPKELVRLKKQVRGRWCRVL